MTNHSDTLTQLTNFVIALGSLVAAVSSVLAARSGKKNKATIAEVHNLANGTNQILTARNEQLTTSMSEQGAIVPATPEKENGT